MFRRSNFFCSRYVLRCALNRQGLNRRYFCILFYSILFLPYSSLWFALPTLNQAHLCSFRSFLPLSNPNFPGHNNRYRLYQ
ncbi:hypothetical protein L6452_14883 [Arctium lappa]|uniref:Uncharacterized protein n=1 Tax=Arctium lappa TaxID=4217 RepID=A0ACB9CMT6_ARCLA|nr:hypothetical protein L6452_14883 [Arctium lappa]